MGHAWECPLAYPRATQAAMDSLLPVVERCDNFRVHQSNEAILPFYITSPKGVEVTIGWIRARAVLPVLLETGKAVFDVTGTYHLMTLYSIWSL